MSIYDSAARDIINAFMTMLSRRDDVRNRVKDDYVNAPFIGIPIDKAPLVKFLEEKFRPVIEPVKPNANERSDQHWMNSPCETEGKAPDYVPPSPATPTPEPEKAPDYVPPSPASESTKTVTSFMIMQAISSKQLRASELAKHFGVSEEIIRKVVQTEGSGLRIKAGGRVSLDTK